MNILTRRARSALDGLDAEFSARLVRPHDPSYDDVRKVHNGLVDRRPAFIARCRGVADVVAAVGFGVRAGLELSIRGGGHNVAGRAVSDAGLMIDLSPMKGIHVDPRARTARVQAGVTWGELDRETQIHGLATTGGMISSTGVAGLTLGGGLGWLMGKHGLTIDNLLSVEVVTAKGEVLVASEEEHRDLFWGLRGGGGNFGVATSFEYRLHPVGPIVTGGFASFPFEQARDVIAFYRELTACLPDELTIYAGLTHAPDEPGTSLAEILACHCGTLEDGQSAMDTIKAFGAPTTIEFGPIAYSSMNSMLDEGFPKGSLNYWKSSFVRSLSDSAIDTMVDCFSSCPHGMSGLVLEHVHGAATRIPPNATAFAHREVGHNMLLATQWMGPEQSSAHISWTRETHGALEPFMSPDAYVNYLADDESDERVKCAYGSNLDRLRRLKSKYDPENIFHLNQNIEPL